MRRQPYNWAIPGNSSGNETTAPETLNKSSFDDSIVLDLSSEFKRPEKPVIKTQPEATTPKTEHETTATPPKIKVEPAPVSGKLREDIAKLKEQVEKELKATIENPQRASENVLKFFNVVRLFVYPWIYKKVLFDGAELPMFDAVMKKTVQAKMAGKEAELNPAEKEMLQKIEFFKAQKNAIPWTEEEIKQGAEVAYHKLAEIKFLSWLMENEWALFFFVIESKRLGPVIGHRMGFGEIKL